MLLPSNHCLRAIFAQHNFARPVAIFALAGLDGCNVATALRPVFTTSKMKVVMIINYSANADHDENHDCDGDD